MIRGVGCSKPSPHIHYKNHPNKVAPSQGDFKIIDNTHARSNYKEVVLSRIAVSMIKFLVVRGFGLYYLKSLRPTSLFFV